MIAVSGVNSSKLSLEMQLEQTKEETTQTVKQLQNALVQLIQKNKMLQLEIATKKTSLGTARESRLIERTTAEKMIASQKETLEKFEPQQKALAAAKELLLHLETTCSNYRVATQRYVAWSVSMTPFDNATGRAQRSRLKSIEYANAHTDGLGRENNFNVEPLILALEEKHPEYLGDKP